MKYTSLDDVDPYVLAKVGIERIDILGGYEYIIEVHYQDLHTTHGIFKGLEKVNAFLDKLTPLELALFVTEKTNDDLT